MIQAFRRSDCSDSAITLRLHDLDPVARHELNNLHLPRPMFASGRELMNEGLKLEIAEKPGAAMVIYRTLTKAR